MAPRYKSQALPQLSFVFGFLMAAFTLEIVLPGAATSQPSTSCYNAHVGVEGTSDGPGGHKSGMKANVWFAAWNSKNNGGDCFRISSIAVLRGNDGVEWGWVLGYHPKGGNVLTGPSACDGDYFKAPESFIAWFPTGGSYHCRDLFASSPSMFFPLSLKDTNTDTIWHVYKSGTDVATINVNFRMGLVVTNGERHNLSIDTAFSHFKDLQQQYAGSSAFIDFSGSVEFFDNDPDFYWNEINSTSTKVSPS